MDYKYTAEKFGINNKGLHLLRNKFNFKSYKLTDINEIRINRGFDLKRWFITLTFGLILLAFALFDSFKIISIVRNPEGVIYIERLLIPLFPFALGLYSLLISLRKATIMTALLNGKKHHFSLRQLDKKEKTQEFIAYLTDLNLKPKIDT